MKAASVNDDDVAPRGNRAMLTLADGHTLTWDEDRDGIVVGQREITYNNGNLLVDVEEEEAPGEITMLALRTPNGGTYGVTLLDGTKVRLNAGTTLKYPSRFSRTEREVVLTGETYFSVVNDLEKPFKVISAGQEVYVLGTEFNVSAYRDDPEIKTTLVEGKVRLLSASNDVELVAGEQGVVKGTTLTKNKVDLEPYVAWK